ncbi:MAG: hypothetical protein ACYTJ0_18960, partial [Planctomycetota bacterium]
MSELMVAGATEEELSVREAGAETLERRLFIALAGGVLLAVSWLSRLLGVHPEVAQLPAAAAAVILVVPLLGGAWREINRGRPSSDSLASLAVIAAFVVQQYLAAGFLALFLWMANLIL